MKNLLIILLILNCKICFAQQYKCEVYISKDNEILQIDNNDSNKYVLVENENGLFELGKNLKIDNQFNIIINYFSKKNNYKNSYSDTFILISNVNNDSFITIKLNKKIVNFFETKKETITFYNQKYYRDPTLKFEKIIFHTGRCYGNCPIINLEIDSNKHIYIDAEINKKYHVEFEGVKDFKNGIYEGILNDSLFKQLVLILETMQVTKNTFKEEQGFVTDVSTKTIILYYNGKRQYVQLRLMSSYYRHLVDFLDSINNQLPFNTNTKSKKLEQ